MAIEASQPQPSPSRASRGAPRSSATTTGPVFLVGLPRSGSTLLSRILNDSPQLFLVNDLYILQEVDALGALEGSDGDTAERLALFLIRKLRLRSSPSGERQLVRSLPQAHRADSATPFSRSCAQKNRSVRCGRACEGVCLVAEMLFDQFAGLAYMCRGRGAKQN